MAQFTFVTAMSVQACLHVGYRNEPNKIEKGQLCQKLTYSQQPTGGGRVLSVILAGTLAMGMTPAVALTTQSLEPVQAFAAEVTLSDAMIEISDGTSAVTSASMPYDPTKTYTVSLSEAAPEGTVITINDKAPSEVTIQNQGSYVIKISYTYTDSDDGNTEKTATATKTFTIDTVALTLGTPSVAQATDLANLTTDEAALLITPTFTNGSTLVQLQRDDSDTPAANTYSVEVTALGNVTNNARSATYSVTVNGDNYTVSSNTGLSASIEQAPAAPAQTSVNLSDVSNVQIKSVQLLSGVSSQFTYNGDAQAPAAGQLYVNADYTDGDGNLKNGQVVLDDDDLYTLTVTKEGTTDLVDNEAVDAGTYGLELTIDQQTIALASGFSIVAKPLQFTAPAFLTAGMDQAAVEAAINGAVQGLIGTDAASTVCDLQIAPASFPTPAAGQTAVTVAGTPVTGSISLAAGQTNYALDTTSLNIPVQNTINIGQDSYAVALDFTANQGSSEYSYNAAAQAPKVVLTNTNAASTTAAPVEGTDYKVYYGLGDAKGSTSKPTAVGDYQVTVEVGSGSTAKTIKAGTYSIESASLNDASEVLITWNGQPINTNANVTINDPQEWENALSMVYPSSGIEVSSADYTPSFNSQVVNGVETGTLTITANGPKTPGGTTNLAAGNFVINYTEANYQIASVTLTQAFLEAAHVYNGQPQTVQKSDVVVKSLAGGAATVDDSNYEVTVTNNINAGTATVTVTGINNYAGKATTTFAIAPFDISKLTVNPIPNAEYDTTAQTPNVTVGTSAIKLGNPATDLSETLTKDNKSKNFAIAYGNNVNATTETSLATVTISAVSPNYTGSQTVNFKINQFDISKGSTTAANLPYVANDSNYDADILTLVSGLTNAKNEPIAMPAGSYIVQQNTGTGSPVAWGNIGVTPAMEKGKVNQIITYTVVGQGNYKGTLSNSYYVTNQSIADKIQAIGVNDQTFNGLPQQPAVTIVLTTGANSTAQVVIPKDGGTTNGFTASYANNRDAGTAKATVAASGLYNGTAYYSDQVVTNFTIKPADLKTATFNLIPPEGETGFSYTGSQIKPAIATKSTDKIALPAPDAGKLKITNDLVLDFANIAEDYSVSYGANLNATTTNAGTTINEGTVTITPTNGNMVNTATVKFPIAQATIEEDDVVASETGVYKVQASGASYAEPEVTVTVNGRILVRDVDYTLEVPSQQEVGGTYTWTIKGIGNYTTNPSTGITDTFKAVNDIAIADIVMPTTTYVYDGTAKEPVPTITYKDGNETTVLQNGKDFKLTYEKNINAGTATVIIEGYGDSWGGKVEKTFTIEQAEGELAITGAVADYTYNGSAATPEPNFTFTVGSDVMKKADLEAGVDYEYVYANNIDATAVSGKKATVGVKMMGNYGAKDNGAVEFTIAQANVANADVVVGDVVVGKTPKVAVSMGGRALVQGTDFTFSADTKTPGTKTATITGKGNYTGTQKVTFTVLNENQVPADDANLDGGTWKKTNGVWQYTTKDGKLVSSGWAEINNKWYYFDSKGNAKTGWLELNGTWYYLNKAGEGTECAMVSNAWKKINGNWYHFAKSGAMQTGWQKINGAWYYLNKKGEGTEGAMRTGWQKINGAWYYLNKAGQGTEGAMKTGWFNDNGTWYYLNANGDMVSNQWRQINGSWFYFYTSGAMAANTWVGNYWVDANGYWVR